MDIDGALLDSNGDAVTANLFEQDFRSDGPMGFTLADRLDAGTHYIKVTRSGGESTGGYAIRMFEDDTMNDVVSDCSSLTAPFTDPLSGCHWNLRNRGQLGGTSGEDIRVEDVWTGGNMGSGIGVAVVDGGLHEAHPDLTDNVDATRGHDYTDDGDGLLHPFNSHGTSVAGVIAARDNTIGGRGVAPRATVYGYNLLRSEVDEDDADAMTRNMATTGVSNNSWGNLDSPGLDAVAGTWEMAIDTGVETGYGGKGVVYVWAAGNGAPYDNSNFGGYTNYYGVTAVCSVDDRGRRVGDSEMGANLWICAPSRGAGRPPILTTYNYGRYGGFGGTSAAAPTVSGVVALVRAANTALTWRDVKLILAASARKNDTSNSGWRTGASKYGASGRYNFNHEYGFGVVDAKAAVGLADGWENLPPFIETDPVEATPDLSIPDATTTPGATQTSTVRIGTEVEFIEFVEVTADFDAPAFRDLQVELVSPSSAVSTLAVPWPALDRDGNTFGIEADFRFGSARHLGEDPAGTWMLRVTDHLRGGHGDAQVVEPEDLRPPVDSGRSGRSHRDTGSAGSDRLLVGAVRDWRLGAHRLRRALHPERRTGQGGQPLDGGERRLDVGFPEATWCLACWTDTKYDVQVRGVNAKGRGTWSESTDRRRPFPTGRRCPSAHWWGRPCRSATGQRTWMCPGLSRIPTTTR